MSRLLTLKQSPRMGLLRILGEIFGWNLETAADLSLAVVDVF